MSAMLLFLRGCCRFSLQKQDNTSSESGGAEDTPSTLKVQSPLVRVEFVFPIAYSNAQSNPYIRRSALTHRERLRLDIVNVLLRAETFVNQTAIEYRLYFDQLTGYLLMDNNHHPKQCVEIHQLSSTNERIEPITFTVRTNVTEENARENVSTSSLSSSAKPHHNSDICKDLEPTTFPIPVDTQDGPLIYKRTVYEGSLESADHSLDFTPSALSESEHNAWRNVQYDCARFRLTVTIPHATLDLTQNDCQTLGLLFRDLFYTLNKLQTQHSNVPKEEEEEEEEKEKEDEEEKETKNVRTSMSSSSSSSSHTHSKKDITTTTTIAPVSRRVTPTNITDVIHQIFSYSNVLPLKNSFALSAHIKDSTFLPPLASSFVSDNV